MYYEGSEAVRAHPLDRCDEMLKSISGLFLSFSKIELNVQLVGCFKHVGEQPQILPQIHLSLPGIPDSMVGRGPHHDLHNFSLFFMQKIVLGCSLAPSWCCFMMDKYLPVFITTDDTINAEQISSSPAASLLHHTSYISTHS